MVVVVVVERKGRGINAATRRRCRRDMTCTEPPGSAPIRALSRLQVRKLLQTCDDLRAALGRGSGCTHIELIALLEVIMK